MFCDQALGWYSESLLKFDLEFLLRKTVVRLNLKIDLQILFRCGFLGYYSLTEDFLKLIVYCTPIKTFKKLDIIVQILNDHSYLLKD